MAFERNCLDVRTAAIPHCPIAEAMASDPAVKFRLTGTFRAMSVATLASAPPTDAGSMSPTMS